MPTLLLVIVSISAALTTMLMFSLVLCAVEYAKERDEDDEDDLDYLLRDR